MNRTIKSVWDALTSLKLTIICLAALMILVVACTLAQVRLGTLGAVNLYMRAWFFWMPVGGLAIPNFPGGATVGLVLMVNLIAAQVRRLELSWKKSGLWIVHAGLILLFVGEFVTSAFQVDARLAVEEGQTVNFITVPREVELTLVDQTDPRVDDVFGISEATLGRGGNVAIAGTPLSVRVLAYQRNAQLGQLPEGVPTLADQGVGATARLGFRPLEPVTSDEAVDTSVALVEIQDGGRPIGRWIASNAIEQPQQFMASGRAYTLTLRDRRIYLPYTLTLEKFSHDVYPGTDIPKNFSSLVRLQNPVRGEDRNVLIYMNQPLRYDGKAFYQASFGKGDTLSILQVVQNPGWLIPYVSTVLVTLGLLVHFAISLRRGLRRASKSPVAAPQPQEAA